MFKILTKNVFLKQIITHSTRPYAACSSCNLARSGMYIYIFHNIYYFTVVTFRHKFLIFLQNRLSHYAVGIGFDFRAHFWTIIKWKYQGGTAFVGK